MKTFSRLCIGMLLLPATATELSSQILGTEVIASTGLSASGQSICVDWTVGEPVTESIIGLQEIFTQGFQQPDGELSCHVGLAAQPASGSDADPLLVFPNPTKGVIQVSLEFSQDQPSSITVHNVRGQLVYSKHYPPGPVKDRISLENVAAGDYYLQAFFEDGSLVGTKRIRKISH